MLTLPIFPQTSGLTTFASFGVLIWLLATRPEPANMSKRLMLLLAFAFLQGLSVGPLTSFAEFIEPGILFNALVGTAVVFGTFSLSVLLAPNVSYLYLGGFLFSGLNLLVVLSFANMFIGSMGMFQFDLYFGLLLFSGFVAYDTQKMITKAQQGSRDYVLHALELFQDAFSIFVRILSILMRNRESDRRRDNRRRE